MRFTTLSPLLLGLMLSASAHAAPSFVNGIAIPGAMGDLFGTSVNDGRLGFFSDIYYDPNRNEWWGLSDRGPGGGVMNYDTRVQRFTLDVDMNTGAISNFQVVQTLKFSSSGASMDGIAPSPNSVLGNAFDPEGVVINPLNGNLIVSDEYGPSVYEFDRTGALVRTFNTPAGLVPRDSVSGVPSYGADSATNPAGKRNNRGFEGLAISPDGQYTYAMLQSAMLDEGGSSGTLNRIVKFDNSTGDAVAQYAYQMKRSSQGQGISALVALNDHEFLVLERNNLGLGAGAAISSGGGANVADKEVYKIDISGATDVSGIDLDAPGAVFAKVDKSGKWLDLDLDTIDLDGDGDVETAGKSPEKWEGLAVGPRLNDGSYLLLAGNDNDYSVTQNGSGAQFDVYFNFNDADPYAGSIQCALDSTTDCTWTSDGTAASLTGDYRMLPGVLHAYKVSAADLGSYTAPVPEPETYALLLAGLGLVGFAARRRG
jgi:hypothetical protein